MRPLLPGDKIAEITITEYGDGSVCIQGNCGDKVYAVRLLQHAIDAIKRQPRPEDKHLILKNSDVDLRHHDNYPVVLRGDIKHKEG